MKKEVKMRTEIKKLTLSAIFLAMGLFLPFLTGQIPQIGSMLLPMHIPVFFCGLICGWQYGLFIGAVLPLMRSLLFGMPPLYPTATAMCFELATYGFVSGLLYSLFKKQGIVALYSSMLISMIAGRIVWGLAEVVLLGFAGNSFTWQAFFAGAFLNAFPGIILQLIMIPALMFALDKAGFVKFKKPQTETKTSNEGACPNP